MRKSLRRILYSGDEEEMRRWMEDATLQEIEQVIVDTGPEDPIHDIARFEQTRRGAALVPVGTPTAFPAPGAAAQRATFWLSLAASVFSLAALVVASFILRLQLHPPSTVIPLAALPPSTAGATAATPPVRGPILMNNRPPMEPGPPPAPDLGNPSTRLATPASSPPPLAIIGAAAPATATLFSTPPPIEDHAAQVRASQERAVAKHPELAQARSLLNARFVAAYQRLKLSNSPRLEEPDWPERLADECAAEVNGETALPER